MTQKPKFLCFELIFVLFLFSYQYKNALTPWIGLDLTLLLSLIILPVGFYLALKMNKECCRNGKRCSSITLNILFLAFTAWCCCRSINLPVEDYPYSKFLCFLIYTMPAFFLSYLVIARSNERLCRFMFLTFIFTIVIHLEAYRVFLGQAGIKKALNNVLGNNYLVTGNTLGIGTIITVAIFLYYCVYQKQQNLFSPLKERDLKTKVISTISLLLCSSMIYIQLNLGGRGPVIAMFFTIGFFYILNIMDRNFIGANTKAFALVIFSCCIFYILMEFISGIDGKAAFIERIHSDYIQSDQSILLRIDYYKSAWRCFMDHLLVGVGFGGWPYYHGLEDMHWHPHNIFLEIASETGLVGLVLFCSTLFIIFSKISIEKLQNSLMLRMILCAFLFCFANALKSGDLNDNIVLFCFLGILAGASDLLDNKKSFTQTND